MVASLYRCLQQIRSIASCPTKRVVCSKILARTISHHPLGSLKLGYPALDTENRVAVVGTGLTGVWSAYHLSRELQKTGLGQRFKIDVFGKEDWVDASKRASSSASNVFKNEASAISPIGIQFQQGSFPWNDKEAVALVQKGIGNPDAAFYVAPNLPQNDQLLLRLYTEWDSRHPLPEDSASTFLRQASLVKINRFAEKIWAEFAQEHKFKTINPIHYASKGAYRLYSDPEQYCNALRSNAVLENLGFGAEAIQDPQELARQLPFFWNNIVHERLRGIKFQKEGIVDSKKLRDFIKEDLSTKEPGKPDVEFHFDSGVRELKISDAQDCEGVVLENDRVHYAHAVVLAAGMDNSRLLAQHNIPLPLMRVWGAAMRAKLKEDAPAAPLGGVSFHDLRCISGSPDGQTMTIAGTSMVVPSSEVPNPSLYIPKMRRNFELICGQQVDLSSVKTSLGARILTPDDLPIISLTGRLIVLNPTYHLGNTQGPSLGKLAGLYVRHIYGLLSKESRFYQLDLNQYRLNRFEDDLKRTENEAPILKFSPGN